MFNKVKELFTGKKEVENKLAEVVETPKSIAVVTEVPKQVHVCDDNCKHDHAEHSEEPEEAQISESAQPVEEAEENKIAPLTYREIKSLKRARYEEVSKNPTFKNVYVIRNTKTNQMVEIRAASSFHACKIIGWKPNRVRVVSVAEIKEHVKEEIVEIREAKPAEEIKQ